MQRYKPAPSLGRSDREHATAACMETPARKENIAALQGRNFAAHRIYFRRSCSYTCCTGG